ncbi:hypothetical protein [Ferruginibacter sp.]|nr:hypothetical protein [Ferruginibacter sp.]
MQRFKKIMTAVLLLLPVILYTVSCKQNREGEFIPVPKDTSALGKIDHFIPLEQIREYQAAFARERDSLLKLRPTTSIPFSEAFNKKAIIEILQIPDCVGIKILYGIKQSGDSNSVRLILVGVDSRGNNLYLKDDQHFAGTENKAAVKKDSGAPVQAAKMASELPGDSTGGIEQGQCDPPCINY